MAVRLRFFNLQPPSAVDVDGESFTFSAAEIQRLPQKEVVARHVGNHWLVGGARYLRLEVQQPVMCCFRGSGESAEQHGPFRRVGAVDGVILCDDQPFALFQKDGWTSLADNRLWPEVALLPMPQDGTPRA